MQLFTLEKLRLGGTIGFHGTVIIQMIPGQIREYSAGHREVIHAALIKGMGGHLHHGCPTFLFHDPGQHPVNLNRIRCRMRRRLQGAGHAIAQGAEDAAGRSRFLEQLCDILADRRLAIGSGHREQLKR